MHSWPVRKRRQKLLGNLILGRIRDIELLTNEILRHDRNDPDWLRNEVLDPKRKNRDALIGVLERARATATRCYDAMEAGKWIP